MAITTLLCNRRTWRNKIFPADLTAWSLVENPPAATYFAASLLQSQPGLGAFLPFPASKKRYNEHIVNYTTCGALSKYGNMNGRSSITLTIPALVVLLALAGCTRPTPYPEFSTFPHTSVAAMLGQHHIVGSSVRGSPIMTQVFGQGPDVVLIMATIHGNEPAGTPLVRRLAKQLNNNLQLLNGRTVILLPLANPDGYAADTRQNARGVDLNRDFAAANRINSPTTGRYALSEPEARIIKQLITQYTPNRIVTIHQPLACIDYDGPARPIADRMAQYCDLPVRKLGARPGSLGSYAGETLRIPTITFEMRHSDSRLSPESLWRKYGKALLSAITYPTPPE